MISNRQFLTSIISEIALAQQNATLNGLNPLATGDEDIKHLLLTLYATFPAELHAALDLLDRGLVHCVRLPDQDNGCGEETRRPLHPVIPGNASTQAENHDFMSAQCEAEAISGRQAAQTVGVDSTPAVLSRTGNDHPHGATTNRNVIQGLYYVKSAQQQTASRARWRDENPAHYEVRLVPWSCSCPAFSFAIFPPSTTEATSARTTLPGEKHSFGGITYGDDLPVCKHLLASYLAEQCPQFRQFVETREVSIEEMAGWAAGWGD